MALQKKKKITYPYKINIYDLLQDKVKKHIILTVNHYVLFYLILQSTIYVYFIWVCFFFFVMPFLSTCIFKF